MRFAIVKNTEGEVSVQTETIGTCDASSNLEIGTVTDEGQIIDLIEVQSSEELENAFSTVEHLSTVVELIATAAFRAGQNHS